MIDNLGQELTSAQQFRDPEEDGDDETCDVCELPVADCVCEEFEIEDDGEPAEDFE